MNGATAGTLVLFAVVSLAPSALFWAALRTPALVRRLRRARPVPSGPPVEQVAADLRRVRRTLAGFPPGTPAARRIGTRQAYDELLLTACRELGVEHRLATLPEGFERELERLRVADTLSRRGLVLH
ncbi:hypothetical protein ATK36_0031 [Amycolatopsis sulphurea]|uniref:Uncharacterized protein n=1 Tax=Amycolatopsis sulphurea TaxID=76022 RepID=A0A2A9G199_9PSEU|nr:hypothetical protein [Amycolatopsis sulphurea]PFG56515.1 hypothetical protein ATK36_0031 [Amycolatopsis sulphurea]